MTDKIELLSLQECTEITKKHFQTNEFEVLQYEETPTFTPYSLVKIRVFINNIQREVRFLVKEISSAQERFSHEIVFKEFQHEYSAFKLNFAPNHHFLKKTKLIVFEDQNYIQPKTLDLNHIKLALKTLAQYHAGSMGFEEIKSKQLGKRYQIIDEYPSYQKDEILESSWFRSSLKALNALIDLFPENGLTHEEFKKRIRNVYEDSVKLVKMHKFRNVLCHGFVWNKNLLFRYNNEAKFECKLINFELMQYQPPALDVLQCIYMSTNTEMRKHNLHDLLDFYYDCLKNELNAGNFYVNQLLPLKEDFEVSIHQFLPLIKLQTACIHQIEYLSQKLSQNNEKYLLESFAHHIIKSYKSDETFKQLMIELIKDLKDLVTHPGLTIEDCFKIIKNKIGTTNYELLNYKIVPLGTISGFLGDHNKLKIEISLNNQKKSLNLFAKFFPKSTVGINLATDSNVFFKETFIYQNFIPMIQSLDVDIINDCGIPCFFTRHNDVMIFDDYEIFNYATLDSRKPFGIDIMKLVIKKMAKFHASSIIVEEKLSEKTQTKYRLGDHFPIELKEAMFTLEENHHGGKCMQIGIVAVERELELFPDPNLQISKEQLRIKIKKGFEMLYELVKPSKEFRNVICHGDLWVNNILVQILDGKPTDCRFIDYQLSRYCPPAQDLLTFIHLTTDRNTRKQHFTELIKFYHKELSRNLEKYGYNIKNIYPYQMFIKSIEYMTPQAVCHTALSLQLNLLTSDVLKELDQDSYQNMILKDRKDFIAYVAKKDPLYFQRKSDSIQDLREMCMKYF